MRVYAPGLNTSIGVTILTRSADMVHNAIAPFAAGCIHFFADLRQRFFPGDTFPLPFTPLANSFQRV
jgi:hypothetical protein